MDCVGNVRSHIFEWPVCQYYSEISPDNQVPFSNRGLHDRRKIVRFDVTYHKNGILHSTRTARTLTRSSHAGSKESSRYHKSAGCTFASSVSSRFTKAHGHLAGRAPTADNLLVFYLPNECEWNDAVARMKKSGYEPVSSFNAYWDQHGLTFEDPDGYRVVLQQAAWER